MQLLSRNVIRSIRPCEPSTKPDLNLQILRVSCCHTNPAANWGNENVVHLNPLHPGLVPPNIHFSYFSSKEELLAASDREFKRPPKAHPDSLSVLL